MNANNNLVTWSSTYSVGVKVIDDQHKVLINLVNDMYNHVNGDEKSEQAYFQDVIRQAVNYIKVHLMTEEKVMRTAKFKGYSEHKRTHDSFILSVVDAIRDFEAGKKFTLMSFTHYIKDWILTHIAILDKQYFDHLIKTSALKANGKLSLAREKKAA